MSAIFVNIMYRQYVFTYENVFFYFTFHYVFIQILSLGDDGMVNHIDNGIRYTFDITKNMFCKGNITEKLRIASWNCENEVVLDMFAGLINAFNQEDFVFVSHIFSHSQLLYLHVCTLYLTFSRSSSIKK